MSLGTPLSYEDIQKGQKLCYGQKVLPNFRYDKADYIVSIDGDFLGSWGDVTQASRRFASTRRRLSEGKKTRLVVLIPFILLREPMRTYALPLNLLNNWMW